MRVLIINTSDRTGGAAVAANRLMMALINNGVKAKMLVRDKDTDSLTVVSLPKSPMNRWRFLWERLVIFCRLRFQRRHLFEVDIANTGADITRLREFQEADIIHLHWINQGMLSLSGIRQILRSTSGRFWQPASLWCGRCTISGQPRPSVMLRWAVVTSPASATIVGSCQEVVRATISQPRYGRRSVV